jgi:FO synthase
MKLASTRDPEALARLLDPRQPLEPLLEAANRLRLEGHGQRVTYSPKAFFPLTHLCRDNCGYCTFARPPQAGVRAYMSEDEVLNLARRAVQAGCREALFTLGDKPERRYPVARQELRALGHTSTLNYLVHAARLVMEETGLLPHANPGVLNREEMAALRQVSASQGLMLEQLSPRLLERGQAHWASPDKRLEPRLGTIALAGELQVPFTTGLLIGIGETVFERAETIACLAGFAEQEHVQELIVQNFRAKPGTLMEKAPEPSLEELLRAVAVTRLAAGPGINIQAPPNLIPTSTDDLGLLIQAGINDWGGVSPITLDHVNPEAPWPHLEVLESGTARAGAQLVARLCVYPEYLRNPDSALRWFDPAVLRHVLRAADGEGLGRSGQWWPADNLAPPTTFGGTPIRPPVAAALSRAEQGQCLEERELQILFEARGREIDHLSRLADAVRREVSGEVVTYVITRNINYTNICYFRCKFCAFSKGKLSENLRGKPELLANEEVVRRCHEAVARGATEVCMQGGIHPDFTGDYYVELLHDIKAELPDLHIHAFSPLEVYQGAETAGRTVAEQLRLLKAAGLGTLPGTAAEILDDRIRRHLCPDKINTQQWSEVMEEAHHQGLRSTSTIMFGSIEGPEHWARHLEVIRDLQRRTGGFTEFVPLPFVHMEAPMFIKGKARRGPTWEEVVKMHATARLGLRGLIDNIQVSWVKCGLDGAARILEAGANDLGGTLMNESISRAAGASHGQEVTPEQMAATVRSIGRIPAQRTTTYDLVRVAHPPATVGA